MAGSSSMTLFPVPSYPGSRPIFSRGHFVLSHFFGFSLDEISEKKTARNVIKMAYVRLQVSLRNMIYNNQHTISRAS